MTSLQRLAIEQDYDVLEHEADRELTDEQICDMADAFGEEHLRADELERLHDLDDAMAESHRDPYATERAEQVSYINRYLEQRRGY